MVLCLFFCFSKALRCCCLCMCVCICCCSFLFRIRSFSTWLWLLFVCFVSPIRTNTSKTCTKLLLLRIGTTLPYLLCSSFSSCTVRRCNRSISLSFRLYHRSPFFHCLRSVLFCVYIYKHRMNTHTHTKSVFRSILLCMLFSSRTSSLWVSLPLFSAVVCFFPNSSSLLACHCDCIQ